MHTSKRKSKAKQQTTITPPFAETIDIDALAEKIYLAAQTEATRHGLEVVMMVTTSTGQWRAKWGSMNIERVAWWLFRLLTVVQRMLP